MYGNMYSKLKLTKVTLTADPQEHTDSYKLFAVKQVLGLMHDEGHEELTMVFGNLIISIRMDVVSQEVTISVGDVTHHTVTLIDKENTP
jgi:hypothetical protein